MMLKYTGL